MLGNGQADRLYLPAGYPAGPLTPISLRHVWRDRTAVWTTPDWVSWGAPRPIPALRSGANSSARLHARPGDMERYLGSSVKGESAIGTLLAEIGTGWRLHGPGSQVSFSGAEDGGVIDPQEPHTSGHSRGPLNGGASQHRCAGKPSLSRYREGHSRRSANGT